MRIFNYIKNSLSRKLLFAFFVVAFVPLFIVYIYTINLAQDRLIEKILSEQNIQADIIINSINKHLLSLQKEVRFISKLDMMDDIVVEDLDKRISRLLLQKELDIGENLTFYVVNKKDKIVASSKIKNIGKTFSKKGNYIYISSKIYASFNKNKYLGKLILEYDIKNLIVFFRKQRGIHNCIVDKNSNPVCGVLPFKLSIDKNYKSFITSEYLILYKKLDYPLSNLFFVYAIDKEIALDFLYRFLSFMIYTIPFIIVLVIFISIYISNYIVNPIKRFTNKTEEIMQTRDYSRRVEVDTSDEIGRLSLSFNKLLSKTDKALKSLELENRLRLQRFVKLIEIFNKIIKTQSEKECIELSIEEIKKLTKKELYFTYQKRVDKGDIPIFVTDFNKNKKNLLGFITLDIDEFNDKNEKTFFTSIATMISLQLDRIKLIEKTISESNAKSAFISNMSHELRTPLNSILGFTQYLIAYENISENQQDIVSNIEHSAHHLLDMINNILDIAKIEAGKIDINLVEFDISIAIEEVIEMLSPLAIEKGIDIIYDKSFQEQIILKSDKQLVRQIVINLLSNSIKFTPKGSIKVWIDKSNDFLNIHIKDSGIGLDKKDIYKLFIEFSQIENDIQKKTKGTGLGLVISKKFAKILKGDIVLKSKGIGKGSESILLLPIY